MVTRLDCIDSNKAQTDGRTVEDTNVCNLAAISCIIAKILTCLHFCGIHVDQSINVRALNIASEPQCVLTVNTKEVWHFSRYFLSFFGNAHIISLPDKSPNLFSKAKCQVTHNVNFGLGKFAV